MVAALHTLCLFSVLFGVVRLVPGAGVLTPTTGSAAGGSDGAGAAAAAAERAAQDSATAQHLQPVHRARGAEPGPGWRDTARRL